MVEASGSMAPFHLESLPGHHGEHQGHHDGSYPPLMEAGTPTKANLKRTQILNLCDRALTQGLTNRRVTRDCFEKNSKTLRLTADNGRKRSSKRIDYIIHDIVSRFKFSSTYSLSSVGLRMIYFELLDI